ncbi:MAG TPA: hypothetical protein VF765_03125 [Polyangiaceae bacterium]
MKPRRILPLTACAFFGAFAACNKPSSTSSSPLDAGAAVPATDAAAASPELSARVVVTGAPISQEQAQAMGMQFAAKRWPQYHPRFAMALHEQKDWKVIIQFQEPGVGGMVIYDLYGEMLDAGTSKGEH